MMDSGYDSDFVVGPFLQSGVEEERLVCMNEEEPEAVDPIFCVMENLENGKISHFYQLMNV